MEAPEAAEDDPSAQEEMELGAEEPQGAGAGGAAGDQELPEAPVTRHRFHPSSIGLTVLLPPTVQEVEAVITWGDYRTEPPLPPELLTPPDDGSVPDRRKAPEVEWVRKPQERTLRIPLGHARHTLAVPDSTTPQLGGGRLELDVLARDYTFDTPNGTRQQVRAVTVFLVNRRAVSRRRYGDLSYAFQARIELRCPEGIVPRHDLSGYRLDDEDVRIADLHYRDVAEYAVGRSTSAGWASENGDAVTAAWTDPLPTAEVERVAPTPEAKLPGVVFGMEALAGLAEKGSADLTSALSPLPDLYRAWIKGQHALAATLERPRQETADKLLAGMEAACQRIAEGIALLGQDEHARSAFRFMNEAVAAAARRRKVKDPKWRPFQLAFILLNLAGLVDKAHPDRETVDLLFFPTGGGKTEAYLGLAAFAIAHRRLTAGEAGAGVTVIMRYTLRLLTLDQLSRAAGVVCALELARTDPRNANANGRPLLGTWPIEIGLWVGSDASPNRLGGKGDTGDDTAVTRVRKYRSNPQRARAPAPIKACPWCGTPFTPESFQCVPNNNAPRNLEIRCTNADCDFTGNRALPILTVDEPIYRRLPAFLIATVDKFASLPWIGECGAFFGHVDRMEDGVGFYGAAEPGPGKPLFNGDALLPPDLIIQDELHLISGPLGTVAGLYETAVDALATCVRNDKPIRPKIVASTATVRRAADQIRLLFDRDTTNIFPPPAVDRKNSFFAVTVASSEDPARLYMGVAAQGRGPKLVFLRALTTLVAAAQAEYEAAEAAGAKPNPADPYMTALCYFNALRELGGARRIVEDDVRVRAASYGSERVRVSPASRPFKDRSIREPLELTSRVSTDKVAEAKQRLEAEFSGAGDPIDVALATNMISVGLDVTRLGLMLALGQPKTAAEYIQATSRVGRDHNRPGLVVTVLNLHTHYESFRQFHCTFYRAVEATSVTPWAARALDRALAAIVVAVARHLESKLTPENAVRTLREHEPLRTQVIEGIVARAKGRVVGGDDQLRNAVTTLLEAWMTTADEQTANGVPFAYSRRGASSHLLQNPLDPALENLTEDHRRFVAGRSMRDVEPNVVLKVRDPLAVRFVTLEIWNEPKPPAPQPARWVLHGAKRCQEPLYLEERGTSADPADTYIVCDCNIEPLSLQQAFAPGRLGKCAGERPWLGRDGKEACDKDLRLLTRTATNTYFPQVATVISLPAAEDEFGKLLAAHADDLKDAASPADVAQALKFNSRLREALKGWTPDDIISRLELLRSLAQSSASTKPKYAEFDILASGNRLIGENRLDARLFAETLPRDTWEANVGVDLGFIRSLVAVHRLREVMCLYGFTRFEAAPTSSDGDIEDVRLTVDGAPLGLATDWLPAIEQFGEGLFLHVDPNAIGRWLARKPVQERVSVLLGGSAAWAQAKYSTHAPELPGAAYFLLHTLSHALISEIALDCGYPASSLKERVYALTDPDNPGQVNRCGILIYTATAGSFGTLGGLVATAPRFAHILAAALGRLQICSNDPVCADHDPANRTDDRALHGAACHGCLLIAETSCEMRNVFLDRALIVETMANDAASIFLR